MALVKHFVGGCYRWLLVLWSTTQAVEKPSPFVLAAFSPCIALLALIWWVCLPPSCRRSSRSAECCLPGTRLARSRNFKALFIGVTREPAPSIVVGFVSSFSSFMYCICHLHRRGKFTQNVSLDPTCSLVQELIVSQEPVLVRSR